MKNHRLNLLLVWALTWSISGACCGSSEKQFVLEEILQHRPSGKRLVFDYADVLEGVEDYSNRHFMSTRDRYSLEAVLVSLPAIEEGETVEEVATELFSQWKIGHDYEGRGLLVMLVDQDKQVKLEVSYELEDVFTDIFCGHIQDLQLRPHYLSGQIGTGLLAVMEEIENRAQIKHQGTYRAGDIALLDKELLSGGAGAKRDLSEFRKEEIKDAGNRYPAGRTPEEAWKIMIQSWRDKVRDPNLGVYTEMTKLAYRDYQHQPDSRYEKDLRTYADKSYEVIQNDRYAVIFFGNKKGWENAPFLLCRTAEGWKFDMVHQRKYIRMGPSPSWAIERADYPYMDLLSRCPYYMGQDIPLEEEDRYTVEQDGKIAARIRILEESYQENPKDPQVALELGRLYTITALGRKSLPILTEARSRDPESPLVHKYLAIAYVGTTYQYEKAIAELKEYLVRSPDSTFGQNFIGYLYFCIKDYQQALKELKKSIELEPDNCYAYCKLSRSYAMLYLKTTKLDPLRNRLKASALKMLEKAQHTDSPDTRRISWLNRWLTQKGLLEVKDE